MIPGLGQITKLNQQFITDVRSRGEKFVLWMKDKELDKFCVKSIVSPEHGKFYRIELENLRTKEECKISIKKDGCHPISKISAAKVFEFTYNKDDVCPDCKFVGNVVRMSCVCSLCGKAIWGC